MDALFPIDDSRHPEKLTKRLNYTKTPACWNTISPGSAGSPPCSGIIYPDSRSTPHLYIV